MFFEPIVYCERGKVTVNLSPRGNCPCCGLACRSFPEFMRACELCESEMAKIVERHLISLRWLSTRAEAEMGVDLDCVLKEADERLTQNFSNIVLPHGLPKLDFIAVALRDERSGEQIVIHDDHYDAKFYWHSSRYGVVNMLYATGNGLNDLVFGSGTEDRENGLLFSDLQIYLHLLSAQNRLWYAMLAEGFYVMPDRPFGFEHLL